MQAERLRGLRMRDSEVERLRGRRLRDSEVERLGGLRLRHVRLRAGRSELQLQTKKEHYQYIKNISHLFPDIIFRFFYNFFFILPKFSNFAQNFSNVSQMLKKISKNATNSSGLIKYENTRSFVVFEAKVKFCVDASTRSCD